MSPSALAPLPERRGGGFLYIPGSIPAYGAFVFGSVAFPRSRDKEMVHAAVFYSISSFLFSAEHIWRSLPPRHARTTSQREQPYRRLASLSVV